jgi:hypothetical protein
VKDASVEPAATGEGRFVGMVTVAAADAAATPTRVTPARTIKDAAPMPTADRSFEIPNLLFITSPS